MIRFACALWLMGCGRLGFDQDAGAIDGSRLGDSSIDGLVLPMLAPVQTAVASQDLLTTPLHVLPAASTSVGNTLVVMAAIDTSSQHLSFISDDGGNSWLRLFDGANSGLTGRVEIWYVAAASPVSDVSLSFASGTERALAVQLTEWTGLAASSPVVGINVPPAGMDSTITTGVATIAAPALVLGATAINGVPITAQLVTDGFTALAPIAHTNVSGATAYRVAPPGDLAITWQLSETRYHTAGIVALRLE